MLNMYYYNQPYMYFPHYLKGKNNALLREVLEGILQYHNTESHDNTEEIFLEYRDTRKTILLSIL